MFSRSPPVFSRSPASEQPSPHTRHDVAIQSPTTPELDIEPLIPENAFLHERQSPRNNVTELVEAAAENVRKTPPQNTFKMQLRPITSSQREAQPLYTSYLTDILTDYNPPNLRTVGCETYKHLCAKTQNPSSEITQICFKDHNSTLRLGDIFHCAHCTILYCKQTTATRIGKRICFHF